MAVQRRFHPRTRPTYVVPLAVAVGSFLVMLAAQSLFRWRNADELPAGYLLQDWSSDVMMQTLPLKDMVAFGPLALWYSHIYPPLQDAIRYLFALPEVSGGESPSIVAVDQRLYVLYALCFGLLNAMVFVWVRSLTGSGWWGLGATLIWAMNPGYLTVMMLLDPSPLAALLISLALLLLYFFLRYRNMGYATGFFAALLLASLARSVTQIQVLPIVVLALIAFWFMARNRSARLMALNVLFVGLLFVMPIKMQVLYATWDSTSFGGYHRVGMLWIDPNTIPQAVPESVLQQYGYLLDTRERAEDPSFLAQMTPEEIRSAQLRYAEAQRSWEVQRVNYPDVDFSTAVSYPERIVENANRFSAPFNTREQVLDNIRLSAAANRFLAENPIEAAQRLLRSLSVTAPELLRPTSQYTQNYLVESLPWRDLLDWALSGWRYLLLVVGAAVVIVWRYGWRRTMGLLRRYAWFGVFYVLFALPILLSNRYRPGEEELGPIWTDAMRQKVFLEMPIWSLTVYALWLLVSRAGRGTFSKMPVTYG